jgi:UDP-glucose:(heptosyl)LPS alpha-1,3-glucosyltransferase
MSDYQAVRRAVGVPLAMREGGLVRWLYQELDCAIGHRLEQRSFSRLISDSGVALHAVSNSVAHAITNYYSCVKPVVIPNPVCLERYSPGLDTVLKWTWIKEKTGWADGVWRHLFVGGGWERKGLAVAIKALALGSSDSVLMVVGQGLESRYRQLADQLGVGRRVYFAGAQKDVEQWYALSNVFVFPSRYEAMPIVCIEALASGLPVLCAPFKGTEMFLREGVNGYSVSSPQEMANRSMQLRADCGIYAAMRSAAVASVVPFAAPRVAAQMLDFLKQARPRGRGNG